MRRKAYIAGTLLALTLMLDTANPCPVFGRLRSSAQNFQQHFRDLKRRDVSAVERLVFSLVLTHSETSELESRG